MDIIELALKVQKMREAQKLYFRNFQKPDLKKSKALEADIDNTVQEILNPMKQQKLFG